MCGALAIDERPHVGECLERGIAMGLVGNRVERAFELRGKALGRLACRRTPDSQFREALMENLDALAATCAAGMVGHNDTARLSVHLWTLF